MISTERLILRRWHEQDRGPFAALNADPLVNRFMPHPFTRSLSDAWLDRIEAAFERDGFGLWAVESRDDGNLAGLTGLRPVPFAAAFTPAVEIGWRFHPGYWGRGLATEAASAALRAGFEHYGLETIVAETARINLPSRRVIERIGMRHEPSHDFQHPAIVEGHILRRRVLYRA